MLILCVCVGEGNEETGRTRASRNGNPKIAHRRTGT